MTVLLVTGAQASGKSTVGRLVAGRAPRGVFLDGDTFWQAVVSGRADMTGDPTPEALEQLHLRYRALGRAAGVYAAAGFRTVVADNVYGADLQVLRDAVAPLRLLTVALTPAPEAVVARERGRGSGAYAAWSGSGAQLLDAVRTFDAWVRATPADLFHDSTGETPEQTATAVLAWALRAR
ncbi:MULTISPECIES: phosphotransferase-like protein [unclassified Geodermatophilus]